MNSGLRLVFLVVFESLFLQQWIEGTIIEKVFSNSQSSSSFFFTCLGTKIEVECMCVDVGEGGKADLENDKFTTDDDSDDEDEEREMPVRPDGAGSRGVHLSGEAILLRAWWATHTFSSSNAQICPTFKNLVIPY